MGRFCNVNIFISQIDVALRAEILNTNYHELDTNFHKFLFGKIHEKIRGTFVVIRVQKNKSCSARQQFA